MYLLLCTKERRKAREVIFQGGIIRHGNRSVFQLLAQAPVCIGPKHLAVELMARVSFAAGSFLLISDDTLHNNKLLIYTLSVTIFLLFEF